MKGFFADRLKRIEAIMMSQIRKAEAKDVEIEVSISIINRTAEYNADRNLSAWYLSAASHNLFPSDST